MSDCCGVTRYVDRAAARLAGTTIQGDLEVELDEESALTELPPNRDCLKKSIKLGVATLFMLGAIGVVIGARLIAEEGGIESAKGKAGIGVLVCSFLWLFTMVMAIYKLGWHHEPEPTEQQVVQPIGIRFIDG